MSLNFYQTFPGTKKEPRHIGLSAGGMFMFQAYPRLRLTTFQQWMTALATATIIDEADRPVTLEEFKDLVEYRLKEARENKARREYHNSPVLEPGQPIKNELRYRDTDGHLFWNREFS